MDVGRILKWIGISIVGLIAAVVMLVGVLHFVGDYRLKNARAIAVNPVEVTNNPDTLRHGAKLALISSCNECHGPDFSGDVMIEGGPIGYLPASNLTSGAGGIGNTYTAEDWARAIRHGMAADGRPLMIMPSHHYAAYSDDDLAALVAYLQSLTPVDNELAPRDITFPGTIIFGIFAYNNVISLSRIEHETAGGDAPAPAANAAYGEYLATIASCAGCHGEDLRGMEDPNAPSGPDITLDGGLAGWSHADFTQAMRTGITPDGRQLDTEMPWPAFTLLTDTEVDALWVYLGGDLD